MLLFANFGVANKEPNRDDIINAAINGGSPSHESLYDWELGWKKTSKAFAFEIIGYYMQYKNQLVLTGEVNNVGEYLRINTPESFRRGIEISANYHYSSKWSIDGSLALSQNKIENFTEYLYNYDDDFNFIGIVNNNFSNTDIGFSPNVIGSARLRYQVMQELFVNLENKYVGRQYLDNTQNVDRSLDPFLTNDISVDYLLRIKRIIPRCFVSFRVNNLFDQSYEPNGYTFSYLVNNVESRNNFYYPQAGRNYLLSLNFKF
jgi:iron complex outermembrane recepter protein